MQVKNYSEREESTIIEFAVLMKADYVKRCLIVPLISIATLIIPFLTYLWMSPKGRAYWFYKVVNRMEDATDVCVVGKCKHYF